jgi:uncharacterized Zn-binding protein involved in type VI secretion
MPNVIRVGDPTSHGGKVVQSGAPHFVVSGIAVALVGDKCSCPIKGHQDCSIATGNLKHLVDGKAVAYDGDKTTCGATLEATVGNFESS